MSIYFQLFLASFLWGTNIIVMKMLLNEIPFLLLATMRVFFSCIFLALYMFYHHMDWHYDNQKKALLLGIIAIYFNFFLTFLGMNEVKGVDNAMLNALAPFFTFLFSVLFLKRKGHKVEYLSLVFTVFAFLLSIRFQIFSIQLGFLYLLLGLSLYMLSYVLIQKWKLHRSLVLTFYELLYGFLFLFCHCLLKRQIDLSILTRVSLWHWLLFLVISGMGFAYIQVIYFKATDQIGALSTSSFLSFNPVVTYIESLIFLGESFEWIHFLSFIFIMIAMIMMNHQKVKKTA